MRLPLFIRAPLGWLFGLSVLLTSLFGNYIVTLLLFMVVIGQHHSWRHVMDRAISFWMTIPMGFLEFFFGLNLRITGDEIEVDTPALIIMNHRTRLDWMYIWSMLYQINPWLITTNKISMKAELKKIPGAGFGMAAAAFVFLQRNIELDKEAFEKAIEYYKAMDKNYQLLLFPEGTDKSPWTTAKSRDYSRKHGLRELNYLIHPRSTGFYHLVTKMRRSNYIGYIYDITVAYPYNIVQSEVDLVLKGSCPKEVHFDIRKIPISEVPYGEEEMEKWLRELWYKKDEKLGRFYEEKVKANRMFPMEERDRCWTLDNESKRKRFVKVVALTTWLGIICICLYHITFVWVLQYGVIFGIIVTVLLFSFYGGIDNFVYKRWKMSLREAVV